MKDGLAIVVTHPIQYYAPLFVKMVAEGIRLKVFYTKTQDSVRFDRGFGREVAWDIPLLEGYDFVFQSARTAFERKILIQQIQDFQPKAVLVIGWYPEGHFALMRYFKGRIPVWFRGDSTLLDEQPGLRKWLRRLYLRWVYSFVDKAFYVGTQNKQYYRVHGLKEDQLVFAPHAVDNERFFDGDTSCFEQKALDWRENLGIKSGEIAILFVGKLEQVKQPKLLIDAFKIVAKEAKLLTLIFAGTGLLEQELKLEAENITNIVFIGFQNQSIMPVVYRLADIVCLPSKSETWGLAINEAMASSRAVLVSNRCGCATDLVHEGMNGFVFEAGNLNDLVRQLRRILKQNHREMGVMSQQIIQNWSFDAQVRTFKSQLVSL